MTMQRAESIVCEMVLTPQNRGAVRPAGCRGFGQPAQQRQGEAMAGGPVLMGGGQLVQPAGG